MYGSTITSFQLVTLIVGVLLPILVAVVTKYEASPKVKALLLLVLSAVAAVLNSWLVAPNGFDWQQAIWGTVTTFIIGVASLFGLWMPTGVNESAKKTFSTPKGEAGAVTVSEICLVVIAATLVLAMLFNVNFRS
jgi:peptidoglycan/LPS O-acetylase OafA/YrhL